MEAIQIKVKRSQMYGEVLNGGSFNYEFDRPPITLDNGNVWAWSGCTAHEAREKYLNFIKTGETPDFTESISSVKFWLTLNGHKTGDWTSRVKQENRNLEFLLGGYKEQAPKWQFVTVIYIVTDLRPYKIPKSNFDKWLPAIEAIPGKTWEHIEQGFLPQ